MNQRRVVITGLGIVSCLGNTLETVTQALRNGQSGIRFQPTYAELGMRSQIAGTPIIDLEAQIHRKQRRFMGDAAAYAYVAMEAARIDAGLHRSAISEPMTGVVVGSGGTSASNQVAAVQLLKDKGIKRVGPYGVTQTMSSTTSACLATAFGIKGVNYSIGSACATSAHCIGHAADLIRWHQQDRLFAGGGEEEHWTMSCLFDAMGALSQHYNQQPESASRPYDAHRDGFVIAGGAGILVLEALDIALARGAKIYGEIIGYGATSDGLDMVAPSGEGAVRCMQKALGTLPISRIDYINTHGTSTLVGDITELQAIQTVFGDKIPAISSTKSLSGHSLGAAGAQEAIYSLLMMQHQFIAGSAHIEQLDTAAKDFPIIQQTQTANVHCVLSNSFGFGGTNACLILQRYSDSEKPNDRQGQYSNR